MSGEHKLFTPFVYSVDGIMSRESTIFLKRLADRLLSNFVKTLCHNNDLAQNKTFCHPESMKPLYVRYEMPKAITPVQRWLIPEE